MNSTATKFATCISGAACWVRKRSAMIADQNAITVASPMHSTKAMMIPPTPGQFTPRISPTMNTNDAGSNDRSAAEDRSRPAA